MHFQPIVEIASRRIVGAEALLRIAGEDGGHLDPRVMVEAAEDGGLIRRIEDSVLDQAAQTIMALPESEADPIHLSVNVSSRRLNDSRFPLALARTLHNAGMPAEQLRLELSPTLLGGSPTGRRLITQLRALGVGVTIDEFASPSDSDLLGTNAVDLVKLERSLVHALHGDQGQARAGVAVAGLAERGVEICAVGVETAEDLQAVVALGCRYAQGYLFSAPVDSDALRALLAAETI